MKNKWIAIGVAVFLLAVSWGYFSNTELFRGAFPGAPSLPDFSKIINKKFFQKKDKPPQLPISEKLKKQLQEGYTPFSISVTNSDGKGGSQNTSPTQPPKGPRTQPQQNTEDTDQPRLQIKRTVLEPALVLDRFNINNSPASADRRVTEFEFCAKKTAVDIQTLSLQANGRGSDGQFDSFFSNVDGSGKVLLFENLRIGTWQNVDVSAMAQNNRIIVTIPADTCKIFRIEFTSGFQIPPELKWFRFHISNLTSNAPRVEYFDIAQNAFLQWLQGDPWIRGFIAILEKEHKLFFNTAPERDTNYPREHVGWLGALRLGTSENDEVPVSSVTIAVSGEFSEPFPLLVESWIFHDEKKSDELPRIQKLVRPGEALTIPMNQTLAFQDALGITFSKYDLAIPESTRSIRFSITAVASPHQNFYHGVNSNALTLPYRTFLFRFAERPPEGLQVNLAGSYQSGWCDFIPDEKAPDGKPGYLSFALIDENSPVLFDIGGINNGGLPPGLTVTPVFRITGVFERATLRFGAEEKLVQPDQTVALSPINADAGFYIPIVLRDISPRQNIREIKIQLVSLTPHPAAPMTILQNLCTYDDAANGYRYENTNVTLPAGTTLIRIGNPELYETRRESRARAQSYPVGYQEDIVLFDACFESYPGNSSGKSYIFEHGTDKREPPFRALRLEVGSAIHVLTSWDQFRATFSVASDGESDMFWHEGTTCLRMIGRDPKPVDVALPITVQLRNMDVVAQDTHWQVPVNLAGSTPEYAIRLGDRNPVTQLPYTVPGLPIVITP